MPPRPKPKGKNRVAAAAAQQPSSPAPPSPTPPPAASASAPADPQSSSDPSLPSTYGAHGKPRPAPKAKPSEPYHPGAFHGGVTASHPPPQRPHESPPPPPHPGHQAPPQHYAPVPDGGYYPHLQYRQPPPHHHHHHHHHHHQPPPQSQQAPPQGQYPPHQAPHPQAMHHHHQHHHQHPAHSPPPPGGPPPGGYPPAPGRPQRGFAHHQGPRPGPPMQHPPPGSVPSGPPGPPPPGPHGGPMPPHQGPPGHGPMPSAQAPPIQTPPPPERAPSYELHWGRPHDARNDVLHDWTEWPVSVEASGNVSALIDGWSPTVSLRSPPSSQPSPVDANVGPFPTTDGNSSGPLVYYLRDLWTTFSAPFALPVKLQRPVRINPMRPPEREVYYVPTLSGFHFRLRGSSVGEFRSFEWYEVDKPDLRRPFQEQMERLIKTPDYSALGTARDVDCSTNSWFAVLLEPVYCGNHTPQRSVGSFLLFYFVHPHVGEPNSGYTGKEPFFRCDALSLGKNFWKCAPTADPAGPLLTVRAPDARDSWIVPPRPNAPEWPLTGHSKRIPVFGLIPSRMRTDVWFAPAPRPSLGYTHCGPLFLITAAIQLAASEERSNPRWLKGPSLGYRDGEDGHVLQDYYFSTRHEKTLQAFAAYLK